MITRLNSLLISSSGNTRGAERYITWRMWDTYALLSAPINGSSAALAWQLTRKVTLLYDEPCRILFNTLLFGDSGLEDDLIDEESPYKGTKKCAMGEPRRGSPR